MQALEFHPQVFKPLINILDDINIDWIVEDIDQASDLIYFVPDRVHDAIMTFIAHLPFGEKII